MQTKKLCSVLAVLLLGAIFFAGAGLAVPPLVDGYYQIGSVEDLQWFQQQVNAGHVTYNAKLTADIDLNGVTFETIGNANYPYSGIFEGGGKTISNSKTALFVLGGGTIRDTSFNPVKLIKSGYDNKAVVIYAGVSSSATNPGIIEYCSLKISSDLTINEGTNNNINFAGFIACMGNYVNIHDCYAEYKSINLPSPSAYNRQFIGGIACAVGSTNNINIDKCYVTANEFYAQSNNGFGAAGGIASGQSSGIKISNSVSLINSARYSGNTYTRNNFCGRISGYGGDNPQGTSAVFLNNYGKSTTLIQGSIVTTGTTTNYNGGNVVEADYKSKSWWQNTVGYDFTNTWIWDNIENIPKLRVFEIQPPTVSIVSSTPVSIAGTELTWTAEATPYIEGDTLTYQWELSTNGGSSWSNVPGGTAAELHYTPTSVGNYLLRVTVTELETGLSTSETANNVEILATYTPQEVTQRTSTIQAKTQDNYQALQEFDFSVSASILDAEWISNNQAFIAAGNAIYVISGDDIEINPLSSWTGNTISKAYLGTTRAIINDIDNHVAIYTYEDGNAAYLTSSGSNALAVTENYAAVVQSGTLNIYNVQNQIQGSRASAATALWANDNTDIFAYYSGRNIVYYTIAGTTLTEKTLTVAPSGNSITSIKQIRGTDNWLVTSSGTNAKTYIVQITADGTSTVLQSIDYNQFSHAQATTSNIIIGSEGTTAYIIGDDGTTQGTYTTGGTLNDVSISKSNGLYAIIGGTDNQAYFLNKFQSSSWILGQSTDFAAPILKTQMSNDGTYALIGTANRLFLFKWEESIESTFFVNGVVIGSDGLPYANQFISIDANQVMTDGSGFFTYPVKPGETYTIVTGTKTTRYTATNQALQTLSIRITSNLIAQDVTYGVQYNPTSNNIEMRYSDTADKTGIVVWSVRNTHTGEEVSRQTVQAGDPAYYFVPEGKASDNYFVTVNAERDGMNVKNTWSVTPSGQGQEVNLFGMDDTGKNILFGFFIILLAGLFGYMHQHIGTIIVAFAAAVLRYLGLITVPWIMIIIAVVVAIVAAIAHRSEGK